MLVLARPRIPVTSGSTVIEMAGPERALRLLDAGNASPVYTRARRLGAIELLAQGDDFRVKCRRGNPQKFTTRAETSDNPKNVWMYKRIATGL